MSHLFPASQPYNTGKLNVGDGHCLTYFEHGNPNGVPVVYLHGGPGAGCNEVYFRYFDPHGFRIVTYDQRAAPLSPPEGFSVGGDPKALITNNTPEILVEDNEKMRRHLDIDEWHIFGGSWGATLALLYAEKYPERTLSLTLRGVFMMREKELDWYLNGTGTFYPEVHREFVQFLPKEERAELLESYFRRLTDPDPEIHLPAAAAWTRYENGYSYLDVPGDDILNLPPEKSLPFALIEAHYMRNFMPTDVIMQNVDVIKDIPTHIVQGRHDVCCPPMSAYDLSRKLSRCTLEFTQAGHSGGMPENIRGLVAAANRILASGTPLKEVPLQ